MSDKTDFEKLSPADQIAIETQVKNASVDELTIAYKEIKSKEARRKMPMDGLAVFALIVIGIIIIPYIQVKVYTQAFRSDGSDICKANNSTYIDSDFSGFNVKIKCKGETIVLP